MRQGAQCFLINTRELLDRETPSAATPDTPPDFLSNFSDEERAYFMEHVPSCYHDFADVFSEQEARTMPPHRPYDHTIDVEEGKQPPHGPIYSMLGVELDALKKYLEEMLGKGFIRPSSSPAGAPVLFAKKKDGSLRLCVDYRSLNKITRKNCYPLPLIGDLLDRLSSAKVFTKIDLRVGFNNIRIAEGEEWKTAFRTRYGSFEYLVMPMGLSNAPATFQTFMNDIFADVADLFVIVYLDDILIFSDDMKSHKKHVRLVLQRLKDNNLFAKLSKCTFHTDTIDYLGFIVSPRGLHMDPAKTRVIEEWPPPKNLRETQSFLGFTNFYRRFILNFSEIANPLVALTRKDRPFAWNAKAQEAFESLKAAFTSAPVLAHYNPAHACILETDASNYALGGILSQIDPDTGEDHPIAFHSRSLIPAERNYEIYDKELLAIVDSMAHWRQYLEGSPHDIQVLTDHKGLEYFNESIMCCRSVWIGNESLIL